MDGQNRKIRYVMVAFIGVFLILTFLNFKFALTNKVDFGIYMWFAVNARTDGHTQTDNQYINHFNFITTKKVEINNLCSSDIVYIRRTKISFKFGLTSAKSKKRDNNLLTCSYQESFYIKLLHSSRSLYMNISVCIGRKSLKLSPWFDH